MATFQIGSTLRYAGTPELKSYFGDTLFKVIDIIPHGMPIGNGECNLSGKNLYRCQEKGGKIIYNFLEGELEYAG